MPNRLRAAMGLLARTRWAGVGAALVVEAGVLAALALAPPSDTIGLPAVVAAAIAGTVAVVYGALDGAVVAAAGAVVFAATGGWGAGELAAIGVWPAVVAAAGLFARRIERRRLALGVVVAAHEEERSRIAFELHDQTAQVLASALMTLRAADRLAGGPAAAEASAQARELINETIQALRELAVELRPKALEDYGLATAIERLAETLSQRVSVEIVFDARWRDRAPAEVELALFRVVQDALAAAVAAEAGTVRIGLERVGGTIVAEIEQRGGPAQGAPALAEEAQRERLRLLGGTLTTNAAGDRRTLRAELPVSGGGPRARRRSEAPRLSLRRRS